MTQSLAGFYDPNPTVANVPAFGRPTYSGDEPTTPQHPAFTMASDEQALDDPDAPNGRWTRNGGRLSDGAVAACMLGLVAVGFALYYWLT